MSEQGKEPQAKRFVVAVPKISEMTQEELVAWASSLHKTLVTKMQQEEIETKKETNE
jgi:hypothetical protein